MRITGGSAAGQYAHHVQSQQRRGSAVFSFRLAAASCWRRAHAAGTHRGRLDGTAPRIPRRTLRPAKRQPRLRRGAGPHQPVSASVDASDDRRAGVHRPAAGHPPGLRAAAQQAGRARSAPHHHGVPGRDVVDGAAQRSAPGWRRLRGLRAAPRNAALRAPWGENRAQRGLRARVFSLRRLRAPVAPG